MIQVTYYKSYNRVTVEGHALSGAPGHDLVCAGASTLAYTLAANVGRMEEMGLVRDAVATLEVGKAEISCRPKNKYTSIVGAIFNSVCAGFELLAMNNPDYISYEIHQ